MIDVCGSDSEVNNDSDISIEEEESGQRTVRVKRNAAHDEFSTYMKKLDGGKQELRSQCKHCSKNYAGKNPTTLKSHLKSAHPKLSVETNKKDEEQRAEIMESKSEGVSKSSSNLKSAAEALFSSQKNKMDNYIQVKKRRSKSLPPRPKEKEIESERLLGFWIGGSTLPVSFVEDPNFELFLQSYDIQVDFHPTQ